MPGKTTEAVKTEKKTKKMMVTFTIQRINI